MSFEQKLLNGIPLAVASAYLVNLKMAGVVAEDRELLAECTKQANAMMGMTPPPPALPPAGQGQHVTPPTLPPMAGPAMGKIGTFGGTKEKTADRSGTVDHYENFHDEVYRQMQMREIADELKAATKGLPPDKRDEIHRAHIEATTAAGRTAGTVLGGMMGALLGGSLGLTLGATGSDKAMLIGGLAGTVVGGAGLGYFGRKAGETGGREDAKQHVELSKMKKYPDLFESAWKNASAPEKSSREVGKERAHASIAAEFEKDKHHKSEATGDLAGRAMGAAAGAVLGRKNPISAVGGAALGQHLGGHAGRFFGAKKDREDWDKAASAMKIALEQAGMDPKPVAPGPLDPSTQAYLATEQAGMQAEEQNEAAFLRTKLEEAQQAAASTGEQNMQLQEQAEQHDQQLADIQAQSQAAMDQASQAQDQVLQQQQSATAMRMAYQQMRGQLLEVAAQDPPGVSGMAAAQDAAQAANPGAQTAQPATQAGPAGEAPSPQAAPGAVPAGGGEPQNAGGSPPGLDQTATATQQTGQKEARADMAHLLLSKLASRKEAGLPAFPFASGLR